LPKRMEALEQRVAARERETARDSESERERKRERVVAGFVRLEAHTLDPKPISPPLHSSLHLIPFAPHFPAMFTKEAEDDGLPRRI